MDEAHLEHLCRGDPCVECHDSGDEDDGDDARKQREEGHEGVYRPQQREQDSKQHRDRYDRTKKHELDRREHQRRPVASQYAEKLFVLGRVILSAPEDVDDIVRPRLVLDDELHLRNVPEAARSQSRANGTKHKTAKILADELHHRNIL